MKSEIAFAIDKIAESSSQVVSDLVSLVDSTVIVDMHWYRKNTSSPHMLFRVVGVLIIAFSVSIPLVVILPAFQGLVYPGLALKDLIVSTMGVAIALFSGLNSFFHWEELYKANMRAMVEIKNCLAVWQLEMLRAKHHSDSKEGDRIALKATRVLFGEFEKIDIKNADEHIQNFNFADKKFLGK